MMFSKYVFEGYGLCYGLPSWKATKLYFHHQGKKLLDPGSPEHCLYEIKLWDTQLPLRRYGSFPNRSPRSGVIHKQEMCHLGVCLCFPETIRTHGDQGPSRCPAGGYDHEQPGKRESCCCPWEHRHRLTWSLPPCHPHPSLFSSCVDQRWTWCHPGADRRLESSGACGKWRNSLPVWYPRPGIW